MIARTLRVYVRSLQRWRRAWELRGERGLRTKDPVSYPLLSEEQWECPIDGGSDDQGDA
ncbi:hypothetical protein [Streptomyces sp. VRA16 Mangrove soil]|uniref:hypothetical protein n=1 Tax=Streptomyces sp. VRA16 Mangrove soil TaxID=2817434 RepID=UPI001A9F273F|nr:hypothetical protein [Streptomyces sp. VRA16 Mangrove soil]MBO1331364.1 hypothetical protein [Streptomyces sp. VRA16 Mangrove soil]